MKTIIMIISFFIMSGYTSGIVGQENLSNDIKKLENQIRQLERDIRQLRRSSGGNTNQSDKSRISQLEQYVIQLNEALSELQQKVLDNEAETQRLSTNQDKQPKIGIYGTFDVHKQEIESTMFDGHSLEIFISGQSGERISYFTEIEFERAANVGGNRGGEILVEEAYTDIKLASAINLRAGIFNIPFGNVERDRYGPLRDLVSKPYTSDALAPQDWSDNGIGFNGKFNLSKSWITDYHVYAVSGLNGNITNSGLRDARQGFGQDNNHNKAVATKLKFHHLSGHSFGFSHYIGAWNDLGTHDIEGINFDFEIDWDWMELIGEYTKMTIDREIDTSQAIMDGYYLRTVFHLEKGFVNNWLSKDFPYAKLALVLQYDEVNIENFVDPLQPDNWHERYTSGITLEPDYSWRIKLNYEEIKTPHIAPIGHNHSDTWTFSIGYIF
ncbi:MAG: porin [Gammaproteobacteria bacterium]|nr:porin [Gammaproteobacteria bacterium]